MCLLLMALAGPAAATGGGKDRHHRRDGQHHRRSWQWAPRTDVADRTPLAPGQSGKAAQPSAGGGTEEGAGGGGEEGAGDGTEESAGGGIEEGAGGGGEEGPDGGAEEGSGGPEDGGTPTEDGPGGEGLGTGVPGSEELLFYRRTAGQPIDGRARGLGEYYDVAGTGGLNLINALDNWSVDHAEIVPLEIDGTDGDELLFYRPQPTGQRGWGEFYDIGPHGGMTLIRRLESWSIDHAEIVAIDIDGDGTDELVFYRRDPEGQGMGWGEVYDVTKYAGMSLLSRQTNWRTDHDMVIGVDVPDW